MKLSALFFFAFTSFHAFSQRSIFDGYSGKCNDSIRFLPDSATQSPFRQPEGLDHIYQPKQDAIFEFRLYEEGMQQQLQSVFIMTLTKDKQWHTRYFAHRDSVGAITTNLRECKVLYNKPDALWCMLQQLKVLSTPDYMMIQPRLVKYKLDTTDLPYGSRERVHVTDGVRYDFMLSSGGLQRSYSYINPQTYLQHFSNIEELYQVCAMVAVIKKYIGIPVSGY